MNKTIKGILAARVTDESKEKRYGVERAMNPHKFFGELKRRYICKVANTARETKHLMGVELSNTSYQSIFKRETV